MEREFPSFIAKDKAINLERRLRELGRVSPVVWRSWADACSANCKRILNALREREIVAKGFWLVTGRKTVSRLGNAMRKFESQWKARADTCVRKMAEPELFHPSPVWRAVAMREASRVGKSKGIGKVRQGRTWRIALQRGDTGLARPADERYRESWKLCVVCNTRGRFAPNLTQLQPWKIGAKAFKNFID